MPDERTIAEIERDLEQARQRLADNLSQLVTEVHPKAVVHRTIVDVKTTVRDTIEAGRRRVNEAYDLVKSQFKDESGWKLRNLAIAGTAVAATATLVIVVVAKKK